MMGSCSLGLFDFIATYSSFRTPTSPANGSLPAAIQSLRSCVHTNERR